MHPPIDPEEDLIEVPSVSWARRAMAQPVGISLTELETPFSESLIG
jgi:hypothetical protein